MEIRGFRLVFLIISIFLLDLARIALGASFEVRPEVLRPGQTATLTYRNPELAGRAVQFHYGFNGWQLAADGFSNMSWDGTDQQHFGRVPMVAGKDGAFEVSFQVPAEARALHFVFCWDECGTGQWDNNGYRDYSWPVAFPYIGPYLTWNDDTPAESGVVVNFAHSVPAQAWVEYWTQSRQWKKRVESPSAGIHHVALTGLKPNYRYYYRVGVGSGWVSKVYSFKTAPAAPAPTTFLLFGDSQPNGDTHWFRRTVTAMLAETDAAFLVSIGDLVWDNQPGHWWTFFDEARELLASRVLMPVPGNHDTPGHSSNPDVSTFQEYFSLPKESGTAAYHFDYGPARFFGLNTENPGELTGGRQRTWLEAELARRRAELAASEKMRRNSWTFTFWHIPVYDAARRHFGQQHALRPVTRSFQGVVDWGFTGHEHVYQRTRPVAYPAHVRPHYGTDDDGGTGFLVVPPAGAYAESGFADNSTARRERGLLAYPELRDDQTTAYPFQGYVRARLHGNQFELTTVSTSETDGPRVMDRVSYSK